MHLDIVTFGSPRIDSRKNIFNINVVVCLIIIVKPQAHKQSHTSDHGQRNDCVLIFFTKLSDLHKTPSPYR